MVNISDISKLTDKFNLDKIVKGVTDGVKSVMSPGVAIPESAKDDPMGYKMLEITKSLKELADLHVKMADGLAKLNNTVGSLYQDLTALKAKEQKPAEGAGGAQTGGVAGAPAGAGGATEVKS